MSNSEIIFCSQVPIEIISNSNAESVDKKSSSITVQVSQSSTSRERNLELQLTDEKDSFFLYQLVISADSFHSLRTEQNILVDFLQFPLKFIELLDECIKNKSAEHPKYICRLVPDKKSNSATLSVIETNSFRNITHISLLFIPGDDACVKSYLAALVKDFKAKNVTLNAQLNSTGSTLSAKIKESGSVVESLSQELESLKLSHAQQSGRIELEHAKQLSLEREKFQFERDNSRIESERNIRNLELKYQDQIKIQSDKISNLSEAHSQTLNKLENLQSSFYSLEKTKDATVIENDAIKRELERTEYALKDTESSKRTLESASERFKERIQTLELREKSICETNRNNEEKLRILIDQKAKLDETIELYKSQNERLEESLKNASDEINKGNDIIRRLQSDLKAARAKIKLKSTVTVQQEKLLDERADSIQLIQKESSEIKNAYEKLNAENLASSSKIEELQKKIEESKTIINDNNHVIEWLHKQLNEDALSRPVGRSAIPAIDFSRYATNPSPVDNKKPSPTRYNRYGASENRPPSNVLIPQSSLGAEKSPTHQGKNLSGNTPPFGQYRDISVSNLATSTTHLGQSAYEAKNPLKPAAGIKSNYF